MDQHILIIIGIVAGFLQAIIIFILSGLRKDIAEIWGRIYNHSHEVHCASNECKTLQTGNVVIPGSR